MNKLNSSSSNKAVKRIRCEVDHCNKTFTEFSNMKRHVKAVHQQIKNFQCELCNATFYRKQHLKQHLMTKKHLNNPKARILLNKLSKRNRKKIIVK